MGDIATNSRRVVNIVNNGQEESQNIQKLLQSMLVDNDFDVPEVFDQDAELTICIGGDGSLLNLLAAYNFPSMPIVGVNTGHLGFFQELSVHDLRRFIELYKNEKYTEQILKTVYADILTPEGTTSVIGLNEIVVKGGSSHLAHLRICIGESFIEDFCGDGVVVSTPAGSTAYNYSLGGSIVDPRLELLQVTPIAAINSTAYRSFTSSILLPPDLSLCIFPKYPKSDELLVTVDGFEKKFNGITEINAGFTDRNVTLLRFEDYSFWKTVKKKLL